MEPLGLFWSHAPDRKSVVELRLTEALGRRMEGLLA